MLSGTYQAQLNASLAGSLSVALGVTENIYLANTDNLVGDGRAPFVWMYGNSSNSELFGFASSSYLWVINGCRGDQAVNQSANHRGGLEWATYGY